MRSLLLIPLLLLAWPAQAEGRDSAFFTDGSWGISAYGGVEGLFDDFDGTPWVGGLDWNVRWSTTPRLRRGVELGFAIGLGAGVEFGPELIHTHAGGDLWLILGFVEIRAQAAVGYLDQKSGNFPDLGATFLVSARFETHVMIGDFRWITGVTIWDNAGTGSPNPGARILYTGLGLRFY